MESLDVYSHSCEWKIDRVYNSNYNRKTNYNLTQFEIPSILIIHKNLYQSDLRYRIQTRPSSNHLLFEFHFSFKSNVLMIFFSFCVLQLIYILSFA